MKGVIVMDYLFISGSPRKKSNTDYLLNLIKSQTGGELIKLNNYSIQPCISCWKCRKQEQCVIQDDMTNIIIPKLIKSKAIIIGSPVFFNNVSAQLKPFIDRTWSIKGKLKNKIGGTIVVGRKYGAESAITAINSFYLKHEMIVANRGVHGIAFEKNEITKDKEAIQSTKNLKKRINELVKLISIL
ncbi:MAG: flavodoxin family protein [Halanaerobiales bacterium]